MEQYGIKSTGEAIRFIDAILREHGYTSSGESISIADTREAWLMELVSKGAGEKGAVWVARRVPDNGACAHANQARITTWPRDDPDSAMWAPEVVSFAVCAFSSVFNPERFASLLETMCDA